MPSLLVTFMTIQFYCLWSFRHISVTCCHLNRAISLNFYITMVQYLLRVIELRTDRTDLEASVQNPQSSQGNRRFLQWVAETETADWWMRKNTSTLVQQNPVLLKLSLGNRQGALFWQSQSRPTCRSPDGRYSLITCWSFCRKFSSFSFLLFESMSSTEKTFDTVELCLPSLQRDR